MKIRSILKAVIAIAVALAFILPGSTAFANIGTIKVKFNSKNASSYEFDYTEDTIVTGETIDTPILLTGNTTYVDDDAPPGWYDAIHVRTIQEGVDNATAGDTVYVYNGTYCESVTVDKELSLVGESKESVFVDGTELTLSTDTKIIEITASNVLIKQFTVSNRVYGIYMNGVQNIWIQDCDAYNFTYWPGYAIYARNCPGTRIENCTMYNNSNGLYLFQTSDVFVKNCKAYGNSLYGFYIRNSDNNNLTENTLDTDRLYIRGTKIDHFIQTIDTLNTINGNPIYYIVGQDNYTLDGVPVGYLGLISCNQATIENIDTYGALIVDTTDTTLFNITSHDAHDGIYTFQCTDINITNATIYNNDNGIYFYKSSNSNTVVNCDVYNNDLGICCDSSSNDNSITYTSFYNNNVGLCIKTSSSGNDIINSEFFNNEYGVSIERSSSNNNIATCNAYNNENGIYFERTNPGNQLSNSTIYNNSLYGVFSRDSTGNDISNCTIYDNHQYGIYFQSSYNYKLRNNNIYNNVYNFDVRSASVSKFYEDIDVSNSINGKPIYYLVEQENIILNETHNLGYLGLISCTNITAINADLSGIVIAGTTDSTISNITGHNSEDGIYIHQSTDNNIINCNTFNNYNGITVSKSTENNITNSNTYNNYQYGLFLSSSSNCKLKGNAIYSNLFNVRVESANTIEYFYNDIDPSNTVEGKPIYYFVEQENIVINETHNFGYLGMISCTNITAENADVYGILVVNTTDSTISNVDSHNSGDGVYVYESTYNTIINCDIFSNNQGIHLYRSLNNNITYCNAYDNSLNGILVFKYSDNNNIEHCNVYNNSQYGIYIREYSENNNVIYCNAYDNSQDGIRLYSRTHNNNIINCNAYNNFRYGIDLRVTQNCNIINCTAYNNTGTGIMLFDIGELSYNNNIINCTAYDNTVYGITLESSLYNTITNCDVYNNLQRGIFLDFKSHDNSIYHNNFVNNKNAYERGDCGYNLWDNEYPNGGNYWSDYTGSDSDGDGIGDTPYDISGGSNQDRYPLMYPWGENPPIANYTYLVEQRTVTFNASSSYDRDGTIVLYDWDFDDGATGTGIVVVHNFSALGTYNVTLTATDDDGYEDNITKAIVIISNRPPDTPDRPSGPSEGNTGVECSISTSTTDPNNDQVYYKFSWGDDTESNWLGPWDSGETAEAGHTWTEEGFYMVKVKAKDVYDLESGNWSTPFIIHITPPMPNLDCEGTLSWRCKPGSTVTDSFTVENIGDPTSELDWEVTEWPDWGEWTFTPSSGSDLTPEDGEVTVEVSVVAPEDKNTNFTGEVKIVNSEDPNDYCIIPVSLTTPKNKISVTGNKTLGTSLPKVF